METVKAPGEEKPPAPVSSAGEAKSPAPEPLLAAEQNVGEQEAVLLGTNLGTDTWNDRMKKLITGLVGLVHSEGIPIGSFISKLIGFFWPSSAENIWDLVKVEYMIDQKILEAEVHQLSNNLADLRQTMEQYVEAKLHEKGALMGAIISSCNDLHSRLVNSDNAVNLIPLTVTLSYMHLANLKERLMHGKEIYEEGNTEVWRTDLVKTTQTYKEDFQTIYAKWQEWRKDNIIVMLGESKAAIAIPDCPVYTGEVNKVPDKKRSFESTKSSDSNPTDFKEICDTVKAMLWKKANGAMLETLLPTFFLDNFMPGSEENPCNPDPSIMNAALDPFSYTVLEGSSHSDTRCVYYPPIDNHTDNNGTWGTFVGNLEGGQLHEVEAKRRLVQNVMCSFNNSEWLI